MRKIFLFLFSLTFLFSFSQNIKATYLFEKKINQSSLQADATLYIYHRKSVFKLSQFKNFLQRKDVADTLDFVKNNKICTDDKYYLYDVKKNKANYFLYDVTCNSKTFIKSKVKPLCWKISSQYESKFGHKVKKATTTIEGKNWVVFFDPSIKTENMNVWKFTGLNGLVVYAFDENQKYFFTLKDVASDYNISDIPKIAKSDYQKMNYSTYVQEMTRRNKERITKKLAKQFNIDVSEVDLSNSPKYETLDFIEK